MFAKRAHIINRKIRFAIVGCGRIFEKHLEGLGHNAKDAELVAVCDSDPKALDQATQKTGAKGYRHLDALLSDTNADIVVIATPSGLHSEQAVKVALSGRHVMTEKPMATHWSDGKAMVQACDQAGVYLFVVKQNRFNSTIEAVKKAVDEGRFGKIVMVSMNVFWTRPQSYYDSSSWRGTWEFDGGALMNQASHYVDLMDYLIGPVESVQALIGTLSRRIEVEDTAVMSVRWRSGALGSLNVTMLTHNKNFEGSITILGETGTVRIGGMALNKIEHWEFAEMTEADRQIQSASYETTTVYGNGHGSYYHNVIQTMLGEAPPLTDGREGLRSLEILVSAYKSARDGRRISLPLEI